MKTICFACLAVVLSLPLTGLATPGDPSAEGNNDQPGPKAPTPKVGSLGAAVGQEPADALGFGGRGAGSRRTAGRLGGTRTSERSIAGGLKWIAAHQSSDGSWRFDPPSDSEKSFANPGTWKSNSAATAMALLPMLGAGQSHQRKGPYQKMVADGLQWLVKRQTADGDLSAGGERRLLSHAWATLALMEACEWSGDKDLRKPAQTAVDFIVAAQDKNTGGWAIDARQSPGTTLSAKLIVALKTAKRGGLNVSQAAFDNASAFLDSVHLHDGAKYGETSPQDVSDASTAASLLARQYLGWKRDNPAMIEGVKYLSEIGPSSKDCVFNFSAKQVMHQFAGYEWDRWQRQMRKQSIGTQFQEGNEAGSWWNPDDVHAAEGGRLLQTAMNCMLLQGYYAYRPLFKIDNPEE